MIFTVGNSCRNTATVPSVECLSATMTSRGNGGPCLKIEAMAARVSFRVLKETMINEYIARFSGVEPSLLDISGADVIIGKPKRNRYPI